jgi:hypothetical protein
MLTEIKIVILVILACSLSGYLLSSCQQKRGDLIKNETQMYQVH